MKCRIAYLIGVLIFIHLNQQGFSQIKKFTLTVFQPPIAQCILSGTSQNRSNDFSIFPNPAKGIINFAISSPVNKDLNIQILTLDGRLVYFLNKQKAEQAKILKIDVSKLPKGMYLINLELEENHYFEPLIIY
jgi:hypothetical protein